MSPYVEQLVTTLEHVTYPVSASDQAELQGIVHAFVDARKDSGQPPERTIAELKDLSRTALRRRDGSDVRFVDGEGGARELMEQIVRWAIERYYSR